MKLALGSPVHSAGSLAEACRVIFEKHRRSRLAAEKATASEDMA